VNVQGEKKRGIRGGSAERADTQPEKHKQQQQQLHTAHRNRHNHRQADLHSLQVHTHTHTHSLYQSNVLDPPAHQRCIYLKKQTNKKTVILFNIMTI